LPQVMGGMRFWFLWWGGLISSRSQQLVSRPSILRSILFFLLYVMRASRFSTSSFRPPFLFFPSPLGLDFGRKLNTETTPATRPPFRPRSHLRGFPFLLTPFSASTPGGVNLPPPLFLPHFLPLHPLKIDDLSKELFPPSFNPSLYLSSDFPSHSAHLPPCAV